MMWLPKRVCTACDSRLRCMVMFAVLCVGTFTLPAQTPVSETPPRPQVQGQVQGLPVTTSVRSTPTPTPTPVQATPVPEGGIRLLSPGRLPMPLERHAMVSFANRVYVIGGRTRDGWSRRVFSASLGNGDTLGSWREEAEIPELRFDIARVTVVAGSRIAICGGRVAPSARATIESSQRATEMLVAAITADGVLAPWARDASLVREIPQDRTAFAIMNSFWLFGGANGRSLSDAVHSADLDNRGALDRWRLASRLPYPSGNPIVVANRDEVFVWGSQPPQSARFADGQVWSADFRRDDMTLRGFTVRTTIPNVGRNGFGVGGNDYLVALGGTTQQGKLHQSIAYAGVPEAKRDFVWNEIQTNLLGGETLAPMLDSLRGVVYVSGGRNSAPTNEADSGAITDSIQAFRLVLPAVKQLRVSFDPVPRDDMMISRKLGDAIPFYAPTDAQIMARRSGKNVLMLAYAPRMPESATAMQLMRDSLSMRTAAARNVMTATDVTDESADFFLKYRVVQLPVLVEMDSDGKVLRTSPQISSEDSLDGFLRQ